MPIENHDSILVGQFCEIFMKYCVSKIDGIYDKWGRVVNAMLHQKLLSNKKTRHFCGFALIFWCIVDWTKKCCL